MTDELKTIVEAHSKRLNTYRDKIERLEDENDELRRRLAELEELVDPDPSKEPDELSKDQKVRKLRKALIEDALPGTKSTMQYDEVRALFDMSISAPYAYDLMDAAGQMKGFAYERAGPNNNGQKRIRVDMAELNDKNLINSVKKESQSIPA